MISTLIMLYYGDTNSNKNFIGVQSHFCFDYNQSKFLFNMQNISKLRAPAHKQEYKNNVLSVIFWPTMKTAAASACCCHCLCPIKLCTIMQLIIRFNLYSLHHDISSRNSILSITINYILAALF